MPALPSTRPLTAVVAAVALLLLGCDTGDGRELREPTAEQRAAMTTSTTSTTSLPVLPDDAAFPTTLPADAAAPGVFTLTAPDLGGGEIDVRFTCDGEDRPPTLVWSAPPVETAELALLVTDDDANGFVHYAVAAIPPTEGEVGEGGQITGAVEGTNDFGSVGWRGPCPPAGEPHIYRWTMYALGQPAALEPGFGGSALLAQAQTTSVASAVLTATYQRSD